MNIETQDFDVKTVPLDKNLVIEASAGTGKTYTLEKMVERFIREPLFQHQKNPVMTSLSEILVVTYTEKAAKELKVRIKDNLIKCLGETDSEEESLRVEMAVNDFDKASIYTIHGFCKKILSEFAFESSFVFDEEIIESSKLVLDELKRIFRMSDLEKLSKDLSLIFKMFSDFKSLHSFIKDLVSNPFLFEYFRSDYTAGDRVLNTEIELILEEELDEYDKIFIDLKDYEKKLENCYKNFENIEYETKQIKVVLKELGVKQPKRVVDCLEKIKESRDVISFLNQILYLRKWELFFNKALEKKQYENNMMNIFELIHLSINSHRNYIEKKQYLEKLSIFKQLKIILKHLLEKICEKKKENNVISFDDMIIFVHREVVVKNNLFLIEGIRNRYKVALLDEAQDTDQLQWEIFRSVFINNAKHHSIFLVGDPKQSIYRFRNADLNVYFNASDVINNKRYLGKNFRSSPELVEALNCLFNYGPLFSLDSKDLCYHNVAFSSEIFSQTLCLDGKKIAPIEFVNLGYDQTIANCSKTLSRKVIYYISQLTCKGSEYDFFSNTGEKTKIKFSDIAVLTRNNKECKEIKNLLDKYSIPAQLKSSTKLFHGNEADDLKTFLQAILNPFDQNKVKQAMLTLFFQVGIDRLHNMNDFELEEVQKKLLNWKSLFQEKGFSEMFVSIIQDNYITEHLLTIENGRQTILNINNIFEILNEQFNHNLSSLEDIVSFVSEQIALATSEYLQEETTDQEAVSILTMHSCKGLEFKIVFISDCFYSDKRGNKSSFLFCHKEKRKIFDLLKTDKFCLEQSLIEEIEEEKRLLYVALTRAKVHLVVPLVHFKQKNHSMINHLFGAKNEMQEFLQFISNSENNHYFGLYEDNEDLEQLNGCNSLEDSYNKLFASSVFSQFNSLVPELKITSFSELHQQSTNELPAYNIEEGDGNAELSGLPKGANTGQFLHTILELIDFSLFNNFDSLEHLKASKAEYILISDLITKQLNFFNITSTFKESVLELIWNVLKKKILLEKQEVELALITKKIHELEFLVTMSKDGKLNVDFCRNDQKINLSFNKYGTMIKGFIDLIFEFNGKYYIADWKSNYLGINYLAYDQYNMSKEMKKHDYYLQYFIYMDALIKILKGSSDQFNYEDNFGGVFYFFLRGMNERSKGNEGIFFHKPSIQEYMDFKKQYLQ